MSDGLSVLKEEDVQRLARLIESLDSSTFDYLQLQVGDMKVTIGKGAVPTSAPATPVSAPAAPVTAPPVGAPDARPYVTLDAHSYAPPSRPAPVAVPPAYTSPPSRSDAAPPLVQPAPSGKRAADGTIEIKTRIMGMYYSQPEPGAPPFVSIGAEVKEDTTVCLIEVMKTFNAMTAGVNGVITEICAENAQLVEYGQVLFRVRPS